MSHFIFIIYIITLMLLSSPLMASSKDACSASDMAKFKELYIELQQKLNYEGTDSYLDKGQLKQKKHATGTDYGGKIFEDALFKEYQNSLRKVAMLFQDSKSQALEAGKSNDKLVDFFKAIETNDPTSFILSNNISNVIDQIQQASETKYNDPKNKKFVITGNDKYLLKRLLTHAQDRIVSVQEFELKNKDQVHFKKDYLKQVTNAPLTRLINVLKNAKITANSNIADTITNIADNEKAMSSAIASNLNDLRKWLNSHKECRNKIKVPDFIQGRIQAKNYQKFLNALTCQPANSFDTLDGYNTANVEALLHFINANEKFLNKPHAQAETAMDELKLEAAIDQTFQNLGTKIGCVKVEDANGKNKYFVQNLPYKDNKFDTTKIICTQKGKKLSPISCNQSFQLVSDPLGRGLEIAKKNVKNSDLTFSIENGAGDCQNMASNDVPAVKNEEPKKTLADCEKLNKDGKRFTLSEATGQCIARKWSQEECDKLGSETKKFKLSEDNLICEELKTETPKQEEKPKKTEAECKKQNSEGKTYKLSEDELSCVLEEKKDPKTSDTSDKVKECKERDFKDGAFLNKWVWDEKGQTCKEKKPENSSTESDEIPEQKAAPEYPQGKPASRFQPISIPTRQIYILPGMP